MDYFTRMVVESGKEYRIQSESQGGSTRDSEYSITD